jgi:hypothetical protein
MTTDWVVVRREWNFLQEANRVYPIDHLTQQDVEQSKEAAVSGHGVCLFAYPVPLGPLRIMLGGRTFLISLFLFPHFYTPMLCLSQ